MGTSATTDWDWITFEELEDDPYPIWARLRREAPVTFIPLLDRWVVTTWDLCDALGRDETAVDSSRGGDPLFGVPNILGMDIGPEHQALRAAIDRPFRARTLQQTGWEERVRPLVARYVERVRERGAADATTEIFEPISARVVADMLGMTDVGDATLVRWFHSVFEALGDLQELRDGTSEAAESSLGEIEAYMRDRIATLHRDGDDGTGIGSMVHASTLDGEPRDYDELIGTLKVIVGGGFQEPGHGVATSLYGVLLDPAQTRAVREEPATAIPLAVHEGLRWIAPFGMTERRAIRDVEIGGVTIPEGGEINLVIGSGNRDETRYDDPDRFDLFRPKLPHMSFGFRSHFCSGHAVSRSLEQLILEEMLARLPGLRLDPDRAAVARGWATRSVVNLPVVWEA